MLVLPNIAWCILYVCWVISHLLIRPISMTLERICCYSGMNDNTGQFCQALSPFIVTVIGIVVIELLIDTTGMCFILEMSMLSFGCGWMLLSLWNLYTTHNSLNRDETDKQFDEMLLRDYLHVRSPIRCNYGSFVYVMCSIPFAFAGGLITAFVETPVYSIDFCRQGKRGEDVFCTEQGTCCHITSSLAGGYGSVSAFIGLLSGNVYAGLTLARFIANFVNSQQ